MSAREDKAFRTVLVLVSIFFIVIVWPFYGPILWAAVFATLFAPAHKGLLKVAPRHRNIAALTTVLLVVSVVLLPLALAAVAVAQEATSFFERLKAGEFDFDKMSSQFFQNLPSWFSNLLGRIGINDLGDLQTRLSLLFKQGSEFLAMQTVAIGQNTAHFVLSFFVMLYLLFFFFRDGRELLGRIRDAIPLSIEQKQALFTRFAGVIRAMLKSALVVGAVQGFLGGVIFWLLGIPAPLLWGFVMALFSLVPAVGCALVWFPVALYLLLTGAVWKSAVLMLYGALVIGLVDNLLRPFVIGGGTNLPDYVALVSTLGGIALFGLNGLVVGPVVAAIFIAAWDYFSTARAAHMESPA